VNENNRNLEKINSIKDKIAKYKNFESKNIAKKQLEEILSRISEILENS